MHHSYVPLGSGTQLQRVRINDLDVMDMSWSPFKGVDPCKKPDAEATEEVKGAVIAVACKDK